METIPSGIIKNTSKNQDHNIRMIQKRIEVDRRRLNEFKNLKNHDAKVKIVSNVVFYITRFTLFIWFFIKSFYFSVINEIFDYHFINSNYTFINIISSFRKYLIRQETLMKINGLMLKSINIIIVSIVIQYSKMYPAFRINWRIIADFFACQTLVKFHASS